MPRNNFNDELNADIRRTLRNAIQKVRRAEKRGNRLMPNVPTVREFKALYTTEQDAKKELRQYRAMLGNKKALERYQTKDGSITNWEYSYIIQNLEATKRQIERELLKAKVRVNEFPDHLYAIKANVLRLEAERDHLSRDLDELTARELKTISAIEQRVKRSELRTISGRKHFMRNLDDLLTAQAIPRKERQRIANKLNTMTNEEFEEFYNMNDSVRSIMERYVPEDENKIRIMEDFSNDQETKEITQDFITNLDESIKTSKSTTKKFNTLVEAGTGKVYTREEFENFVKTGKWI